MGELAAFLKDCRNTGALNACLVRILSRARSEEDPRSILRTIDAQVVVGAYLIVFFPRHALRTAAESRRGLLFQNAKAFVETFEEICGKVEAGEDVAVDLALELQRRISEHVRCVLEWQDNPMTEDTLRRRIEGALVALLEARRLVEGQAEVLAEFDLQIGRLREKLALFGGDFEALAAGVPRLATADAY